MLLSLDKAFLYCFSTRQQAKSKNFKEMMAILQVMTRWIEVFKGSHLHVFYNNFAVAPGLQKTSIRKEAIQPLRKIAMLCAEHNIEVQAH